MTVIQAKNLMTSLSNDDKIALLEAATGPVTLDTEGIPMVGFSICFDGLMDGFYLPFNHVKGNLNPKQAHKVFKLLDTKEALIMFNAWHDLKILKRHGYNYRGKFYDLMLMCHWINEMEFSYRLDDLAKKYVGAKKQMPPQMEAIIASDGWNHVPVAWMDEYSSNDAFIEHQLFNNRYPHFVEQGFDGELWATEQEFVRDVMGPMMDRGIKVDVEFAVTEYFRGTTIMQEAVADLGFKPSSSKALKKFLLEDLELPVVKHTKACLKCNPPKDSRRPSEPVDSHTGPPSFDKDAMEEYEQLLEKKSDDRAETILRYRGWLKTTSSNYKPYMDLVDNNFVLHPQYKLHGTRTGRLSCEKPNLQQIPKSGKKDWNGNLKRTFIARDGFGLWTVDYSQLQFRMTCGYAEQMDLVEIFNDPTRDIFTEMATGMAWLRDKVKTLVYLILFGGGAKRASVAFGVSVAEGKELVEEFHSTYPNIKKIAKDCERVAQKQGYVAYWTGRRRHFPRGSAYYRAFNAVIQGGEAEIIKRAMIRLQKEVMDENCYMVLQIHDEIAFEIRTGMEQDYLPRIQKVMEEAAIPFCKHVGVDIHFKTSAKKWGEK